MLYINTQHNTGSPPAPLTAQADLYVTLSERNTELNPTYSLTLFNFFTNVTYTYPVTVLETNIRYDKVQIDLGNEDEAKILEEGLYKYIFYETTSNKEMQRGVAKVYNSLDTPQRFEITPDEEADDYIVYKG